MTRKWAYRAIRKHRAAGGNLEMWEQACVGAAERFTQEDHHPPLHRSECGWIGRSVSRWTWRRFTPERFSEIQAQRGRGGKAVIAKREERNRRIRELQAAGYTQGLIARVAGVSRRTVSRVIHSQPELSTASVPSVTKPYQDNSSPCGKFKNPSGSARGDNSAGTAGTPDPAGAPRMLAPALKEAFESEGASWNQSPASPIGVTRLMRELVRRTDEQERPPASRRDWNRAIAHALLQEAQATPMDWPALRALPGWTKTEQWQMDADQTRLGEDHAYQLWLAQWERRIEARE